MKMNTKSRLNDKKLPSLSKNIKNFRKPSTYIFNNLLPIYQARYIDPSAKELTSERALKEVKDAFTQCSLIENKTNLIVASYLSIPHDASFDELQIRKISNQKTPHLQLQILPNRNYINKDIKSKTTKVSSYISQREVGLQTYTNDWSLSSSDKTPNLREDLICQLSSKLDMDSLSLQLYSIYVAKLVKFVEQLSDNCLMFLLKYFRTSENRVRQIDLENLLKLNKERTKLFDNYLSKQMCRFDELCDMDMANLITLALSDNKRKGVRFEASLEKRNQALDRFKRAVRFVILNREWLIKGKDKKEEREKFLFEYDKFENEYLTGKKLQILFNKDEFKAQKNLNTLLTDIHRRILTKEVNTRTADQVHSLSTLIASIPRLNTFPKHVCEHIGQTIRLVVFEKGREIVREGHRSIGFYFIVSGGCDVLSVGTNSLLKIDELGSGDTFGDNSFTVNGRNTTTVITNQPTELLTIEPSDIEDFLAQLRLVEKSLIKQFISDWWPVHYWNWSETHFNLFAEKSDFLRFNFGEIVHDNSLQQVEKIFFIYKGKVDLIRLVEDPKKLKSNRFSCGNSLLDVGLNPTWVRKNIPKKSSQLYKICTFEKNNYFGFETSQYLNSWFLAAEDDVQIVKISKQCFLSIHKHAGFFLSQLVEDYKLSIPDLETIMLSLRTNKKP